jgi:NADH:ubiquinone oxidoreductase subunit 6 (subunit J)
MHILVYTGAILVLFLFVIMLLNLRPEELGTEMSLVPKAFMALCCAAVAGCLAWSGWQQFRHDKEHLGAMASFEKRSVDREPMYRCLRHPRGMVRIEPGRCTERLPDGGTCGAEMRSLGDWGGVRHLGWELFHRHALAFEILSLLIIIAIFGGVVLAKRRL